MMEFRTSGFNGYAVKYSSFYDNRLAAATSANYGLVGNGRLYILRMTVEGIVAETSFDTSDSLYDVAWSEQHADQAVVACGDGTVKLFDTNLSQFPVQNFQEHNREVYAVSWNLVAKDTFASSSWDGTIKIWTPQRAQSLLTLPTHSCTYSTAYSPHSPSVISSVTSDSHLRVFDLRTPASASNHLVHLIPIHGQPPVLGASNANRPSHPPSECLTHDWNKYRNTVIATAGVDQIIRTFDLRNPKAGPMTLLQGHEYAIRKLAWSPHSSDLLLSASYDMTCRLWTDGTNAGHGTVAPAAANPQSTGRQVGAMGRHTEFATGVDWCLFGQQGWVASTAWDERVCVWDSGDAIRRGIIN